MIVLGISAFYHDSAACILKNGILIAASQQERFSRIKNDPTFPKDAIRFCLSASNLSIKDVDVVAYYEDPILKLSRQIWANPEMALRRVDQRFDPNRPEKVIRDELGFENKVEFHSHHKSHAAGSFLFSGFETAAFLTVDGVGEWAATTYGRGNGVDVDIIEEVEFPNSIGLLYSTITAFLGFKINSDEYKVMGLAPYGEPVFLDKLKKLITLCDKGQYLLNMDYFSFLNEEKMYNEKLCDLLNIEPRIPESKLSKSYQDLAKSLQVLLEQLMLEKVNYLHSITGEENLCLSGGVALNCVSNGMIKRKGPFSDLFIQPSAGDAGCSLGAAALSYAHHTGKRPNLGRKLDNVYLGPEYSNDEIGNILSCTDFNYLEYKNTDQLCKNVVDRLVDGKVVGWFQGRTEFGPRALGSRSILADPRVEDMRDKINLMVKKREGFRPFAPAVMYSKAGEHFQIDQESPFMLETCQVNSTLKLPAITHVDGSARVQTVRPDQNPIFHALISEFEKKTGCPIILNTSFNVRSEPIVNSPIEAIECFISTNIDFLAIGNFLIDRSENVSLIEFLAGKLQYLRNNRMRRESAIVSKIYTFI